LPGAVLVAALVVGAVPRIDSVSRLYAARTDQRSDVRRYYASTAEAALEGRGWRPSYPTNFIPPPGQAVFIYVLKRAWPTADYQFMRSIQALVSILTIAAAFCFGRAVAGTWTGALAASLVALDAALAYYVGTLLPETNYVFLLFCFGWALTTASRRASLGLLAVAGVILGVASLFKPIPTLLGGVVAIWIARPRYGNLRAGLVFLIAFLAPIAPWILRNWLHYGQLYPISTNGGTLLSMANAVRADNPRGTEFWEDLSRRSDSFDAEIEGRFAGWRDVDGKPEENLKDRAYMRRAIGDIIGHPLYFAGNYLRRLARYIDYRDPALFGERRVQAWLALGSSLLGVLGLVALCEGQRREAPLAAPLLLVGYLLGFGALWPLTRDGRMNLPFRALASVPAAYLVVRAGRRLSRRPATSATS
jgi:hypothetical protein